MFECRICWNQSATDCADKYNTGQTVQFSTSNVLMWTKVAQDMERAKHLHQVFATSVCMVQSHRNMPQFSQRRRQLFYTGIS